MTQLMVASEELPSFTGPGDITEHGEPLHFVKSGVGPVLVCLSSIVAIGGPHEYAKLAAVLGDSRDIVAFPWLGFEDAEPLPATLAAAIEVQAVAVRNWIGEREAILLGHSSGGLLTQAVAAHLEGNGAPPVGVVLLDPPPASAVQEFDRDMGVLDSLFEGNEMLGAVSDTRLVAMAAYLRLLREWEEPTLSVPTFVARAEQQLAWKESPRWDGAHVIDVPGGHFSMMDEYARSTAEAISGWLAQSVHARVHS